MKVRWFNHWFKYKIPVSQHFDQINNALMREGHFNNLWEWLDKKYDVGQYYNFKEGRNYLVFRDQKHYLIFLLKL